MISTQSGLVDLLTSWRISLPDGFLESLQEGNFGPAVQAPPWRFQQTANAYHHSSKNAWGVVPAWVIDIHDMQAPDVGTILPRGPFRDRTTSELTPDVGGLVTKWCKDPTWRQSSTVQNAYRVIIPDRRAYIENVEINKQSLIVTLSRGKATSLECALSSVEENGREFSETKTVSEEIVRFDLPTDPRSVEVYLLDESDEWCDRYRWYYATNRENLEADSTEPELLQQLLAPRYAAVRTQFAKAVQLSVGENPDYANAAKEAVCAVESIAQVMSGRHDSTLGQIVKSLKKEKRIDPTTASGLATFWAYANRLPNVRHGGVTDAGISAKEFEVVLEKAEAAIRYFLEHDL
jgi:hypothetical protein